MKRINYGYAFAAPHRITLCRPSASEKILMDVDQKGIGITWSFQTPKDDFPLSWTNHPRDITMYCSTSLDGEDTEFDRWYRHESGAPYFFAVSDRKDVTVTISAIACKAGVIIKSEAENKSETTKKLHVQLSHTNGWVISNQGWIDKVHNHVLLRMNGGRADRILALGKGADNYVMYGFASDTGDVPMTNVKYGVKPHSMKKITSLFVLEPNQTKVGYYLIPYESYFAELSALEALDFEEQMHDALCEWETLLARGTRFEICDKELIHAYRSCLADLFVMREQIGGYTGVTCGTDFYRSSNSGEPLETEILFDVLGYEEEALADYPLYLDGQDENGCWATSKGWEHEIWGIAYNKANAVMTHYHLTKDLAFLEKHYEKMYRSSMFNHQARQSTKQAAVKGERGLMPRGMGDCGMMNGADYYGVFYSANCQALAADYLTIEAAKILGKEEDTARLLAMYEEAKTDLLTSIRENAVQEDGYVRMPSVVTAYPKSTFGCFFGFWPAEILDKDDEIIQGSIRYLESCAISEGGLPMGTGWMKDGLWVAMALGNISRAYLRMGFYEKARNFLYPALNHASYFVTYCEERGWEKGSTRISGDKQHLWTPLSICQYMADMVYFSFKEEIHLMSGICPEWLDNGEIFSVNNIRTQFGNTSMSLQKIEEHYHFTMQTERPITKVLTLHTPTIGGGDRQTIITPEHKTKLSLVI